MAATNTKLGDYIEVYINNVLIANGTDCKIDIKFGTVKTTTKNITSGANTYEYTDSDWTVSGSAMYAIKSALAGISEKGFTDLLSLGYNKTKVTLKFGSVQTGEEYYSGSALIESINKNAAQKTEVTYSYTFKGDGPLTETTN